MSNSVETGREIKVKVEQLVKELTDWEQTSKKAAAKRARKLTLELEKQFKVFRKQSVLDSSNE
jgi:hypothetical protein